MSNKPKNFHFWERSYNSLLSAGLVSFSVDA